MLEQEFKRALIDLINKQIPIQMKLAVVTSVDTNECTCAVQPVDDSAPYEKVKLRPVINDTDPIFVLFPEVGSHVIIACIQNTDLDVFVVSVAKFEMLRVKTNNVLFEIMSTGVIKMSGSEIKMNNGSLGGLLKLNDTISRLNIIESSINDFKALLTSWVVVANDGGAALKAITASWSSTPLIETTAAMVENSNVKQ